MNKSVALETLGCKVNQYESSFLLEQLRDAGYRMVSYREQADIYIVHSCAVTSNASYQTRQLLRRAKRLNPAARIAVMGCNAQLEWSRIDKEQLATHILGNDAKYDLVRWLEVPGFFNHPCRAVDDARSLACHRCLPVSKMHTDRARAFLKVQDGCDAFCSYCIVPYTRGKSRSLPAQEVRMQMDRFLDHSYREVVLSGIHLGQWGKDFAPSLRLIDLLNYLGEGRLPCRIRLSSLEPGEWSQDLISLASSSSSICPHFHIPLQSGDEDILESMHRPYTPGQYADLLHTLRSLFPEAALGADVLVGFPGETERQFQNTFDLINELPVTYLHVFPFSSRPGTQAERLAGRIDGNEIRRRTQALRNLGDRKRRKFYGQFVGRYVDVLVESQVKEGWWRGTTRNYLKVDFSALHPLAPGMAADVRITEANADSLTGTLDSIRPL